MRDHNGFTKAEKMKSVRSQVGKNGKKYAKDTGSVTRNRDLDPITDYEDLGACPAEVANSITERKPMSLYEINVAQGKNMAQ